MFLVCVCRYKVSDDGRTDELIRVKPLLSSAHPIYWLPGRIWHPRVAHHLALRWLPTLLPVGCACGEQRQSCRNRRWVKIGGKVGIVDIGQYTSPLLTLVAYLRPLREILMLRMTTPPSELLYLSIIHLYGAFIFREMNGESWVNEKIIRFWRGNTCHPNMQQSNS